MAFLSPGVAILLIYEYIEMFAFVYYIWRLAFVVRFVCKQPYPYAYSVIHRLGHIIHRIYVSFVCIPIRTSYMGGGYMAFARNYSSSWYSHRKLYLCLLHTRNFISKSISELSIRRRKKSRNILQKDIHLFVMCASLRCCVIILTVYKVWFVKFNICSRLKEMTKPKAYVLRKKDQREISNLNFKTSNIVLRYVVI